MGTGGAALCKSADELLSFNESRREREREKKRGKDRNDRSDREEERADASPINKLVHHAHTHQAEAEGKVEIENRPIIESPALSERSAGSDDSGFGDAQRMLLVVAFDEEQAERELVEAGVDVYQREGDGEGEGEERGERAIKIKVINYMWVLDSVSNYALATV